jgi:predicted transcriptional regulator of viral defense system
MDKRVTLNSYLEFAQAEMKLKKITLAFPSRAVVRYTWGSVPIYDLAQSLYPESYFTHQTAMFLHGLIDESPTLLYLNIEQAFKYREEEYDLEQDRIDQAFQRPPRISKNIANCEPFQICILNGMHTGQIGVETQKKMKCRVQVTNVERTLIDIAVRPFYSGGVHAVLHAYRKAKGKVSIKKLVEMLTRLAFVYPYHQAIGFYLDKAGVYESKQLDLLQNFEMNYDFYLTYQMSNTSYSEKWRIYFPKEL